MWICNFKQVVLCLIVQEMIIYGALALLFLLTIILLSVDIDDSDSYPQHIPHSTTRIHIAALVFLLICFSNYQNENKMAVNPEGNDHC